MTENGRGDWLMKWLIMLESYRYKAAEGFSAFDIGLLVLFCFCLFFLSQNWAALIHLHCCLWILNEIIACIYLVRPSLILLEIIVAVNCQYNRYQSKWTVISIIEWIILEDRYCLWIRVFPRSKFVNIPATVTAAPLTKICWRNINV